MRFEVSTKSVSCFKTCWCILLKSRRPRVDFGRSTGRKSCWNSLWEAAVFFLQHHVQYPVNSTMYSTPWTVPCTVPRVQYSEQHPVNSTMYCTPNSTMYSTPWIVPWTVPPWTVWTREQSRNFSRQNIKFWKFFIFSELELGKRRFSGDFQRRQQGKCS